MIETNGKSQGNPCLQHDIMWMMIFSTYSLTRLIYVSHISIPVVLQIGIIYIYIYRYLPIPLLGQDMTQGQFLSGVLTFEFRIFVLLD